LLDKIQNEKIVSLILGGPNKYYNFSNEELTNIFREIKSSFISRGYKAIIIPSMRTPKRIIDLAIKEFLIDGLVVNSVDKQAYLSSLAIANSIVVTCDSTSMISEAATSGKPIFVAHMQPKRNNYRFKRFYKLFRELGVIKNLGEKVENWTYDCFNEAERIAAIINSRLIS
jgi:mitochondrial fission protein ELM1